MDKETENKIFKSALEALKKNINIPVAIEVIERGTESDGRVLRINIRNTEINFCVEIKATLNKSAIGLLLHQQCFLPHPQLCVAHYINPATAEELRKNNIQFIDTAGNVFINTFPLYVYVKNNKPVDSPHKVLYTRAFRPAGLKIIYALLCHAELLQTSFRDIAKTAGVALGSVAWVIRDLEDRGFLISMGKRGRRLLHTTELFTRWCTEYAEHLRPKLVVGTFEGPADWWEKYRVDPDLAQWGGEVAAYLLTNYLKPQATVLYVEENNYPSIIVENRLQKNNAGEIELVKRFWRAPETFEKKEVVHPLLIYADLTATGNQRNIQTARILYERYVDRYLRED